jgi:hypothetical protein
MIATHGAFDDIERLLIAICALAQGLLPAHVAGKHGIRKRHHFRPVLGTTVTKNLRSLSIVRKFFSVHSVQSAMNRGCCSKVRRRFQVSRWMPSSLWLPS